MPSVTNVPVSAVAHRPPRPPDPDAISDTLVLPSSDTSSVEQLAGATGESNESNLNRSPYVFFHSNISYVQNNDLSIYVTLYTHLVRLFHAASFYFKCYKYM